MRTKLLALALSTVILTGCAGARYVGELVTDITTPENLARTTFLIEVGASKYIEAGDNTSERAQDAADAVAWFKERVEDADRVLVADLRAEFEEYIKLSEQDISDQIIIGGILDNIVLDLKVKQLEGFIKEDTKVSLVTIADIVARVAALYLSPVG